MRFRFEHSSEGALLTLLDDDRTWNVRDEEAARLIALRHARKTARQADTTLDVRMAGPSGIRRWEVGPEGEVEIDTTTPPAPTTDPAVYEQPVPVPAPAPAVAEAPVYEQPVPVPAPAPAVAEAPVYEQPVPAPAPAPAVERETAPLFRAPTSRLRPQPQPEPVDLDDELFTEEAAEPRAGRGSFALRAPALPAWAESIPLPAKIGAGALALALLATAAVNMANKDGDTQTATSQSGQAASAAPAGAPSLPLACRGGADPAAIAREGAGTASTSTITQNGMTVPSPTGAVEAAAAFARLRLAQTGDPANTAAYQSILAPNATPAARQMPGPGNPGTNPALDMNAAHWQVIGGNGATADIALLLSQTSTVNGKPTTTQMPAKVTLSLVGGAWRLADWTASPVPAAQLATAPTLDTKGCK